MWYAALRTAIVPRNSAHSQIYFILRTRVIIIPHSLSTLASHSNRRTTGNNNNKIRYTREFLLNCFRSHRDSVFGLLPLLARRHLAARLHKYTHTTVVRRAIRNALLCCLRASGTKCHRICINSHDLVLFRCFWLGSTQRRINGIHNVNWTWHESTSATQASLLSLCFL